MLTRIASRGTRLSQHTYNVQFLELVTNVTLQRLNHRRTTESGMITIAIKFISAFCSVQIFKDLNLVSAWNGYVLYVDFPCIKDESY